MSRIIYLLLPLLALQAFTAVASKTTLLALFSCDNTEYLVYCENRTSYLVQLDPSTGQYVKGYNVSIDVDVHYPGPYTYNVQNDAFCFSMENTNRSAPPVIYALNLKTNKTRSIEVPCGNNCFRFVSLKSYGNEVFGIVYPERNLNNFTFVRVDLTTNKSVSIPISLSANSRYGTSYGFGVSHVFLQGVPYVIFLVQDTNNQKKITLIKINFLTNAVTYSPYTIPYCAQFQAYSSEFGNTMFYCYNTYQLYLIDFNRPGWSNWLYGGFSVGGALDVENKKFYTYSAEYRPPYSRKYSIYTYDIQTDKRSNVSSSMVENVFGLTIYRANEI